MNLRFFIALALTAIVIVITPRLFPNSRRNPVQASTDSTAHSAAPVSADTTSAAAAAPVTQNSVVLPSIHMTVATDTTTVHTHLSSYTFSAQGGIPIAVSLDSYPSRRPGIKGRKVELIGSKRALTEYSIAIGHDTIALDTVTFHLVQEASTGAAPVEFTGDASGHAVRISYEFASDITDSYLIRVRIHVAGTLAGSTLFIRLPQTLQSNEPDTLDDINHLAVSFRPSRGDVSSVAFSKLDSLEVRAEAGPINWVATRNKYFLVAFRATKTPFSLLRLQGASRSGKVAPYAYGSISLPLDTSGLAAFDIYSGPQNFERLQQLGGDLDQVNPYAGWLHAVVQPFATIVMKALLWMKRTTQLNYGWVLVLFGVIIRLVLWPLNQGAMRTSMKMQRLQPELQALQKKYSDDPKRQQEAIMKVYKEHGMSPLSPLMGCLPMLLPMPVLFALYYVFQNTIEFRGVSFLWLPDISLRDPFYITPLLMGVSMFVMSWIGMRNSPPNPQAKMMSYMMPVMLTVLFLNFAAGLNLYYAVQNIAALPQQWLLARERGKIATPGLTGTPERGRT
jgi:YidC/Oxa1 family membrane protein insertase